MLYDSGKQVDDEQERLRAVVYFAGEASLREAAGKQGAEFSILRSLE